MSKRAVCLTCHYPQSTCVCSAVKECNNQQDILVIQHPSEAKNAKNTVRLLSLSLNKLTVISSADEEAMLTLKTTCLNAKQGIYFVFPNAESQSFETEISKRKEEKCVSANLHQKTEVEKQTFIFIDATWRKAKRIWLENPWMAFCQSLHFDEQIDSLYHIRKTSIDNGLSTLEAVAYVLQNSEEVDVAPLLSLFEHMQSFWLQRR